MIDIHCHLLPGVDDGAADDAASLEMARIAVADGIRTIACTPHIYPGLYENKSSAISARVEMLQRKLRDTGIALQLTMGADAHLTPELLGRLRNRTAPTLAGSRYFLLEPPTSVAPPRFADAMFAFVSNGYVPVLTHPERLAWIKLQYASFATLVKSGVWLQVTAGSLTGRFGKSAQYFSEKLLDDGLVHVLATDAHGPIQRPPLLSEGVRAAERWIGADEARRLVNDRPQAILDDSPVAHVSPVPAFRPIRSRRHRSGLVARLVGRRAAI